MILLIIASLAAGAYLLVGRHGSSRRPHGFASTSQAIVTAASAVPMDAQKVQRFTEVHTFDVNASVTMVQLQNFVTVLQTEASHASGRQRELVESTITATLQASDAIASYRRAVAFTYRLSNATAARANLDRAIATIQANMRAWSRA